MEVVYEKTIVLKYNNSQHSIGSALNQDVSTYTMLIDILMPLAVEEDLEHLLDELFEKNLIGEEAPDADLAIKLETDELTITVSQGRGVAGSVYIVKRL